MAGFIVVLVCSVWLLYEYVAYWGILDLPFIHLQREMMFLFQMAGGVAMKWSSLLGAVGLVYGVVGIVLHFKDNKVEPFWLVLLMYGIASLLVIFL